MRAEQTSFLFGANAPFIEELYARYPRRPQCRSTPSGAPSSSALAEEQGDVLAEVRGASWAPNGARVIGAADPETPPAPANRNVKGGNGAARDAAPLAGKTEDEIRAAALRHVARPHADPRLPHPRPSRGRPRSARPACARRRIRELDPATYGFTEADWDRPILIFGSLALGESATLRQIMDRLRKTYCGKIGVEFMHISDPDQKAWIQERIEHIENHTDFTVDRPQDDPRAGGRGRGARDATCGVKFVGTKRFGLDGGESLIPGIEQILKRGGQLGVKRGRDRHAASRPPQHARARHAQELHGAVLRVPGPLLAARGDARLGRREVPSRRLGRPRVRRQRHPSLAGAQSLASRGGEPGRAGQGARQAGPARRHRPQPGHGAS